MKNLILILIIICGHRAFGQMWTTVPGTKIEFSNLIHPNYDNWDKYYYEYFRKGDTLICVGRNEVKQFYNLFQKEPFTFDSIFINTRRKFRDTLLANETIKRIKFKSAILIASIKVVEGENETIWILANHCLSYACSNNPCFTNVAFQKEKNNEGKTTLKFLSARHSGCHL